MTAATLQAGVNAAAKPQAAENSKSSKIRVQLDFPPKSMERLTALKEKTEASSYAEVMKNALRLYEVMIEEAEAGHEFLIKDRDGNISPLRIFV